ncbi:MAG: energy transducer TonB [Saprospiraceae bacterium]|nr:energy transducer TonB [Saprospiraceae bacterium]
MSQNLLQKFVMDDIVFDNRNKEYGAWYLRRIYDRIMSRSLVIGLIFFVLLVSSPMILNLVRSLIPQEKDDLLLKEVVLAEPPPIDPNKEPPPPPPKVDPPPIKDQIRFVPPKVMKDEEVENEEPPPPDITELQDKDISTENREGDESGIDASLVEPPPPPVIEEPAPEKPFDFVEQMPEFPDGQAAMMKFIQSNMKYPAIARENDIQGTVVVQFVVGPNGSISKVNVARGIGGGCDEEAVRVVKSMPKWKPGKHNGKAVPVNFTLPIKFRLE